MKKLFAVLSLLILSFAGIGQTYNPSLGTTSNKAYAPAQATPTDFRSYFYDQTNFVMRAYQSTSEVLAYLNLAKYRTGQFPIVINSGGSLANGVITGGINTLWYFKDGVADANLVIMIPGGSSTCVGCLINTNNLSDVSNVPTALTNLGIGSMGLLSSTAGGDLTGVWPAITVSKFNGQLPSYYLNYNNLFNQPTIPAQLNAIAGTGMTITGTFPNLTFAASGAGFTTAGIYLKLLSASSIGLDTQIYRKVDTMFALNDSVLRFNINGSQFSAVLRGGAKGGGAGVGSVTIVSVNTANGVSGSVSNATSTPAITLVLGNITPTSVNGLTLAALTTGFTIQGGTTSKTLTVPLDANVSGTNTGDVTLTGETYITRSGQVLTLAPVNLTATQVTGILKTASFPAETGDVTNSAGSLAMTIANNAVSNAKMATMVNLTLKGNVSGSTAIPSDLTGLQVNTMLPTYTALLKGLVPASVTSSGLRVLSDTGWALYSGSGGFNTNVGGFYTWAVLGSTQIKTAAPGFGIKLDSVLHAGANTIITDTTVIQVKGQDSIFVVNPGPTTSSISLAYVHGDTIFIKQIQMGANLSYTQNNDSSVTLTGQAGTGAGITGVGTFGSQTAAPAGAVISGATIYFQPATATTPGMIAGSGIQTIAPQLTLNGGLVLPAYNQNGMVLYTGGASSGAPGTIFATQPGVTGQYLRFLTSAQAPSFQYLNFISDSVQGVLPILHGGNGSPTPVINAGSGVTITGGWGNYTISATGLGGVSSVSGAGGPTGLTLTGGPTGSVVLTLGGVLNTLSGGTGAAVFTTYGPIVGGTTGTGPLQQVLGGGGTAGYILTAVSPNSVPVWAPLPAIAGAPHGTFGSLLYFAGDGSSYTGKYPIKFDTTANTTSLVMPLNGQMTFIGREVIGAGGAGYATVITATDSVAYPGIHILSLAGSAGAEFYMSVNSDSSAVMRSRRNFGIVTGSTGQAFKAYFWGYGNRPGSQEGALTIGYTAVNSQDSTHMLTVGGTAQIEDSLNLTKLPRKTSLAGTDSVLIKSSVGIVYAVPASAVSGGGAQNLQSVLTTGSVLSGTNNIYTGAGTDQLSFTGSNYVVFGSGISFRGMLYSNNSKNVNYNVTATDVYIGGDASSGSITESLPSGVAFTGQVFVFKKIDATVNTVTINVTGGANIDGVSTYVLNTQYQSVTVISNGSNYSIIGTSSIVGPITSGIYTPSTFNTLNISTSTPNQFTWTRIGNIVTVYGSITFTATSSSASCVMGISLPVTSPSLVSADLNGTCMGPIGNNGNFVIGDAANHRATLTTGLANNTSSNTNMIHFQYLAH